MAFSQITITFEGVPNINDFLNIYESHLELIVNELFVENRLSSNEVSIPTFVPADGVNPDRYFGFISDNYKNSVDADRNLGGEFFTIVSENDAENTGTGTVTITANYPNAVFEVVSNFSPANITITNETVVIDPPPTDVNAVTPLSLNFEVVKGISSVPPQNLNIQTIESWNILDTLPNWLVLSALSGTGDSIVSVTPVNYSSLTVGLHTKKFDIIIGTDVFEVTVRLSVSDFIQNPFSPGKLYFTQQLEYLAFVSETPGTYIDFNIEIKVFKINTYVPLIYNRTYKFPLFQGKGDFHIGSIVHELFEEIQELVDFVPNLKSNYSKAQYRPAEITVSFEEKTFGAAVPGLVSSTMPMFKMAKGHKPFTTENQLALLTVSQQEVTRITPNSFVGTSFVYFGTPRVIVKKNNVVIDDFEIEEEDPNKVIFSYFRFVNDVKPGDSLEMIIVSELETRSQRFLVFHNGMESTYFFFENDNQMLEPYEFTGRRRVNSTLKNNTTTKFKDLYSYESKVKSTIGQSFIVNTGNLDKTDHRVITAIMSSAKVWCSFDNPEGPYFRVDATTSKINNQDTSSNEENFDIEFNILENANASIYPR